MWKVYRTDEFKKWFNDLNLLAKESILKDIIILSTKGSKISNLKELRTKSGNSQYRTIFCFDPERDIILLVGGNKSNVKKFYESIIPKAEQLYFDYLKEIRSIKDEDK